MVKRVALSFSGGKDCCLALYELQQGGIDVVCLVTAIWAENRTSVAYNQSLKSLQQQANRLNIPIEFVETTFDTYLEDFVQKLVPLKSQFNLDGMAFGDIYIQGHRDWGEQLAEKVNLKPVYPLWNDQDKMLLMLKQFIELGFQAKVINIDEEKLPATWVGRKLDESFVRDIQKYPEVCPMGESGEYHTEVYGGPIFIENNDL